MIVKGRLMKHRLFHILLQRQSRFVCTITILILTQAQGYAVEYTAASLLSGLQQKDKEYLTEFTLHCNVISPGELPQGTSDTHVRDLTIAASGESMVTSSMILRYLNPEKAIQKMLGFSPNPNAEANTLYGSVRYVTLQEPDFIGTRDTPCIAKIGADGTITPFFPINPSSKPDLTKGFSMVILDVPGPDRPKCTTEDALGLMTMGRGFSKYLETIVSIKKVDKTTIEVDATGHAFRGQCQWKLMVDTNAALLVRSAKAWKTSNGYCYFLAQNEGIQVLHNVPIPKTGTFARQGTPDELARDDHKHKITFLDFERKAQSSLITAIQQELHGKFPEGTQVSDCRAGYGDKRIEYIVGEKERKLAEGGK